MNAEKDRQRVTTHATGGTLSWIRKHIIGEIVGAALVVVFIGWLKGFFDSILHDVVPSAAETACDLRESIEYHWPFATQQVPSKRFTILIATIDRDDADHTYTRAVARAFLKRDGIERIPTCRILSLSSVGRDAEINMVTTARKWLEQRHADLLIGGEMLKKEDAVSLWFIDRDPTHDWQASTFHLDANLLKKDFSEAASTQLMGVALSAIKPATEENGRYLVGILKPVAERLHHILERPSEFTATQIAGLNQALGLVLTVIGDQAGDNAALVDAAKAYHRALQEFTHERAPLPWAMIEANLGNAYLKLGERERGTEHLQQGIEAYRLTLQELTRQRTPILWAQAQTNLSAALERLGARESGTEHLQQAVEAAHLGLQELTRQRTPILWARAQMNLGAALGGLGWRESDTEDLQQAVEAYRLALQELNRERVPFEWAKAQVGLSTALGELGERESGTEHLQQAVEAAHLALQEFTRERVPLEWAGAQWMLSVALGRLGAGESGTEHLQQAVEAAHLVLQELTRERDPLKWARAQENLGTRLAMLGERERERSTEQQAVEAYRLALQEFTRERVPLEWAQTLFNMGMTLALFGERLHNTDRLKEAAICFQQVEQIEPVLQASGMARLSDASNRMVARLQHELAIMIPRD